jgi:opacity protein-like surface antigen/outer membrane protein OmpA-like peptidoglycan-associated protein
MKHKLLIAAAATILMAAPTFASAQDTFDTDQSGWYLKGAAGYGIGTDIDATGTFEGDFEAEGNVAGNLGLGYDFGENWRIELDGTTNFNDYGAITQTPASFAKLRTDALMLNAIYDFSDFDRWQPYIGAGLGIIRGDASLAAHDFPNVDGDGQIVNPTCVGDRGTTAGFDGFSCDTSQNGDTDAGIGWQLLAGLGYAITDKLTWDTNYRYVQSPDMDFDATFTNVATGNVTNGNVELDGVGAHQLLTGFRYRFGESAPKPMPKPPMVPTADFRCWDGSMVFNSGQCPVQPEPVVQAPPPEPTIRCWDGTMVFDSGQCLPEPEPVPQVQCPDGSFTSDINFCAATDTTVTLGDICGEQYRQEIIYYEFNQGSSAETRNTISRILDAGQFCDVQSIRVVGHTDTSGAASYNLALSKRRAADALNELVRQGISRNLITSEGKGETEPFVQTGDGVKEQLNRRTEVLITLGSVGVMN